LPLRHHFIKGDVLWTEEGHRLSWRMMLRFRDGYTSFKVVDKKTGHEIRYNVRDVLTPKQKASMNSQPDMIWQMAQRIHKEFAAKGIDVAVFADAKAGVNGAEWKPLIDPATDLAAAPWNYVLHNDWILMYDAENKLIK